VHGKRRGTLCFHGIFHFWLESCWSDFDQFCDAAGGDPFGDEEIAIWCEAGIMWVDELAILPLIRFAAQVFDFIESFDCASQSGDDFVLFVQQPDAGFQFGDEHQISVSFDVGRQAEAGESFAVLPSIEKICSVL